MGVKGKRKGNPATSPSEPNIGTPEWRKTRKTPKKTTSENSEHRRLCELGAKWLHRHKGNLLVQNCPYVAVEIVTINQETPDIFGWDYCSTVLIEVKTSRSDFLADTKKHFRLHPEQGLGTERLYLCPEGLIRPEELPERWGLLYEKDGKIKVVQKPEAFEHKDFSGENHIYASVYRRTGIVPQVFDFRNRPAKTRYTPANDEMLLKWRTGRPKEEGFYMVTVESDGFRFVSKDYFDGKTWDNFSDKTIKAWIRRSEITPFRD